MSFIIGGRVQSVANLSRLIEIPQQMKQEALIEAGRMGFQYLEDHTPVDLGYLLDSAEWGVNQYSVWFFVAASPLGPLVGGEHNYGFYQEWGWHDRGGGWHEGHHMVGDTGRYAAQIFVQRMSGLGALMRSRASYVGAPITGPRVPGSVLNAMGDAILAGAPGGF